MAPLVAGNHIPCVGFAKRVCDQGLLARVELRKAPQLLFCLPHFVCFSPSPAVQGPQGRADDGCLMKDEISEVIVVGLRLQKGSRVVRRCLQQNGGD